MSFLLGISRAIDWINLRVGQTVLWLVLATVVVSASNALMRYAFNVSSNAWLELQWYMFGAIFLLCAGYTLYHNEHIRIDIVSNLWTKRARDWIDVAGHVFFLFPLCTIMILESWNFFALSFNSGEISGNAGGLIRWPAKLLLPVGFALLMAQGLSELIKRLAILRGIIADPRAEKTGPH